MALDPADYTVAELEDALEDIEDPGELEAILAAERDGKDRVTAVDAIESRLEDAGAGDAPGFDPGAYEIAELGPALGDIEDVEALEAILDAERGGEARDAAITLIESRIEKFTADEAAADAGDLDPAGMSAADVANAIRDIDDVDRLDALLDAEAAGDDRDSVKRLIEQRKESVEGSGEGEEREVLSPEQKYPELDHPTADKRHVRALEDGDYRDMWVYCETQQGALIDVSREMLGKARDLMDAYNDAYGADEQVVAVIVGADVAGLAEECIAYGADVAVYLEDDRLSRFLHKPYTEVFCDVARGVDHPYGREDTPDYAWHWYDEPRYTVFPATNNGRDLSAMVQAELDSGLASDCSDLYIENAMISNPAKTGDPGSNKEFDRILHMKRPDFSGFEYSTILCIDKPDREFHPQGASVIPGSFPVPDPDPDREGEVVEHTMPLDDDWFRVAVSEHDTLAGGVDLTGHDVIVCLGRGIGRDPTRGIEVGLDLVDAFDDADLGITRGIVTSSYDFDGHVEQYTREERQIGETGQVVEPQLYIAAGVSGAIQHKVGMDESDTIVAINTDPDADIRGFSDYFIEGDLFTVLPRLTAALEAGEIDAIAATGGDDD